MPKIYWSSIKKQSNTTQLLTSQSIKFILIRWPPYFRIKDSNKFYLINMNDIPEAVLQAQAEELNNQ